MEGTVNHAAKIFGILAILTAGAFIGGCKTAPPLAQTDAQAMIQAKYDQMLPQPFIIVLTDLGNAAGRKLTNSGKA